MRVLSISQASPTRFPKAYTITFNDVDEESLGIANHSLAVGAECSLVEGVPLTMGEMVRLGLAVEDKKESNENAKT